MALPCPGPSQISIADIQTEFGGSNPIAINEYYRNGLYVTSNNTNVPTSGQISFANFFCAVAEIVVYITQNSENVNVKSLFDALNPNYWTQNIRKRVVVNPGVVVGSLYTSTPALTVPSGASSTVTIDNNGSIQGAGGFPDIIRSSFSATKNSSSFNRIIFNGPNTFSYDDGRLNGDELVYTNTNYAMSCYNDSCGCSLTILAPNAIGVDDSQGCSPDGDYNDLIVYVSTGYFFASGGTIYYRIDSPYGNGPTGGNAILANGAVSINNQGTILSGGGAGGRGGDGGGGYYNYTDYLGRGYFGETSYGQCPINFPCPPILYDLVCIDQAVYYDFYNSSNTYSCTGGGYYDVYSDGEIINSFFGCNGCTEIIPRIGYTSGGAGGAGGQGQGYAQDLTGGGPGFPGGINAGSGANGGAGGSFGSPGNTGDPGGNGNYTGGGAGRSGGSAGCYIVNNGNVTWIATGDRRGNQC